MMANHYMGTIYIGVTDNLINRVMEHKSGFYDNSFTYKYKLDSLVYYEKFNTIEEAMNRERQLKKWNRNWKIRLIIENNPDWNDLFFEISN